MTFGIHRLNRLADRVYKNTNVAVVVKENENGSFALCVPDWEPMDNLSYESARAVLNSMRDTTGPGGVA